MLMLLVNMPAAVYDGPPPYWEILLACQSTLAHLTTNSANAVDLLLIIVFLPLG